MEWFSYMISDEVKKMTKEERKREIARLEEEGKREWQRMQREKVSAEKTRMISVG